MNRPRVSVCVVTFNHERYIHDCLMSVIAQSDDADLEILVGDDQSEDGTRDIVEALARRYPEMIRYFRNEPRLGAAENYVSLIERASGQYVAHLDGDDFWLPGKLKAEIDYLEKHADSPAVYTNAFAIDDDGLGRGLFNNPLPERFTLEELLSRGNFICHSSLVYRAEFRERVQAVPTPFIDYRIHLLLARSGPVGYVNRPLVAYRVNSSSSMLVRSNDAVRQRYWEALTSVPRDAVDSTALAKGMAEFGRSVFFRALSARRPGLLREWIPVILSNSPVGRARTIVYMLAAVVRVGIRETAEALRSRVGAGRFRVLYRR